MATIIPANFTQTQALATGAVAYFTCPANLIGIIRKASFVNVSGVALSVTVFRVPNGGTADPSNVVIDQKTLAAGESWICNELNGMVFGPGDSLNAFTSLASSVNISVSGVYYTT